MDTANEFGTRLLTTEEAADKLGLSTRTLEDWRLRGIGPRHIRLSPKAVRYRPAELRRFVESHERLSTSDTGAEERAPS